MVCPSLYDWCRFSRLHRSSSRFLSAFALSASALVFTSQAFAEEAPALTADHRPSAEANLLLDDARLLDWVLQLNPEVAAARARTVGAAADVAASGLLLNPELGVDANGFSVGRPTPRAVHYGDPLALHIGLSETIELGKRGPRSAAAEHRRRASTADYRAVVADKVSEARDALAQFVYLQSRQAILEERLKSAQQVLQLSATRLQHGDISGTDHDRLTLEEASVLREAAENRAALAEAEANCEVALAAPCHVVQPEGALLDQAARLPASLPNVRETAQAAPRVQSLEEQRLASVEDAKLARNKSIPDPTVSVGYTRDFYTWAGNQPHTMSVGVSIPLALFDTGYHQARSANSAALAASAEAHALAVASEGQVRGLIGRKLALESKLQLITKDLLPRAGNLEHSSQAAYQQGQLSLTDLVLVRRDLLSLRLDDSDTRYQLFSVRNQLRRLLALDGASPQH